MSISSLELVGVSTGLVYVLLAVRASNWCWLFGAVSAAAYMVIFWLSAIYLDAALSGFYLVMSGIGLLEWHRATSGSGAKPSKSGPDQSDSVTQSEQESSSFNSLTFKQNVWIIAAIGALSCVCAWALSYTDSPRPLVDSATTIASLVATYMLVKRYVDNWSYWICINTVNVIHYFDRDLLLTAGLYLVYLFVAIAGLRAWRAAHLAVSNGRNAG